MPTEQPPDAAERYRRMYNARPLWWRILNRAHWWAASVWAAVRGKPTPGERLARFIAAGARDWQENHAKTCPLMSAPEEPTP